MKKQCSGGAFTDGLSAAVFSVLLIALSLNSATPATAFSLDHQFALTCEPSLIDSRTGSECRWNFGTITRIQTENAKKISDISANQGRLGRDGFAISDLTTEQTVARLAEGADAALSWDRQVGIARELSAAMSVGINTRSLTSQLFLLMPAAFNTAYLSDFMNFTACTTAHTFIFAGALDGRSDARHVTVRSKDAKENICLDIKGAACSGVEPKFRSARRYFHSDWQCRYHTKFPYYGRNVIPLSY